MRRAALWGRQRFNGERFADFLEDGGAHGVSSSVVNVLIG
jgi:hypothetical protein